jgi:two-component system chemotaxis response regulator CheB
LINSERLRRDVVVIGGSAGGLEAIRGILDRLPQDLDSAIAVVIHRSPHFESQLPRVLGWRCRLPVVEPADGDAFEAGHVYAAPRDQHMLIDGERIHLNRGPKEHGTRPAIDPLFVSAAKSHGARVVGALVSGYGSDGVSGLIAIKEAGGISLVQEPGQARVPIMPLRALADDDVDAALSPSAIGDALIALGIGEPLVHRSPPRRAAR